MTRHDMTREDMIRQDKTRQDKKNVRDEKKTGDKKNVRILSEEEIQRRNKMGGERQKENGESKRRQKR